MARSRIFVAGAVAAGSLACLAACNVVLGLGDYEKVGADGGAADAADERDVALVPDAANDAPIDVEAGAYNPGFAWASWPMPNPANDAGYPNQASYEAGADSGIVLDTLTQLQWENIGANAPSKQTVSEAQTYCAGLAATKFAGHSDWRLPTRIELVSLIDYTRGVAAVTIDPVFVGTPADIFWSASPVGAPAMGTTWRVDFGTGEVHPSTASMARVRCVRGGKPR